MKKHLLLLLTITCFYSIRLSSQTEVKISPLALIFGAGGFGIEYGLNAELGFELSTIFTGDGGIVWGSGKYYFNPREGLDRFHVGLFVAGGSGLAGLGIFAGTKIISRKNILFEFGLGAGRSFDDGIIPYASLSLGYRFNRR